MPREAIHEDVSEAEGVFNNDRLARMNQLSADRDSNRDTEDADDAMAKLAEQAEALDNELRGLGGGDDEDENGDDANTDDDTDKDNDTDDDGDADADTGADDDDPDQVAADSDQTPESPLFYENGEWMTRIKVDGEVKIVPYAKIQAAAQKLDAGDKRLEEANRLMKEVEDRERKMLDNGQSKEQPPAQGADGPGQTETGQNEEILSLTRQYHDALLRGDDEDTTATLLAKLATAGGRAPQVDVDKLVEETERRVRASLDQERQKEKLQEEETERRKTIGSAFETFKAEFEDLAKDDGLLKVADNFTLKVAAEHPTYTPLEVMREAGKRTRKWIKEKAGDTPRVNRKRNLKTASGNGTRQTPAPEAPPKKRGDVLNDMRRNRGQTALG